MQYEDNYLLDLIKDADEEAKNLLFKKYEPMIKNIARRYIKNCQNLGLDVNDLTQEAMLVFNNCILTFDQTKDNLFYTYLKVCIENKMLSLIIKARRPKYNVPTVPLVYEDDKDIDYLLSDHSYDPGEKLIDEEYTNEIYDSLKEVLTPFEQQVLSLRVSGFVYKEIASILDKDVKSIDNTLSRIRTKAKKLLNR